MAVDGAIRRCRVFPAPTSPNSHRVPWPCRMTERSVFAVAFSMETAVYRSRCQSRVVIIMTAAEASAHTRTTRPRFPTDMAEVPSSGSASPPQGTT